MVSHEFDLDVELQQVLWACYDCWRRQEIDPAEREVCFSWVAPIYQKRFRATFHQQSLSTLAKTGLLRKTDTARSGHRRYYKIPDPRQVTELLREWVLL